MSKYIFHEGHLTENFKISFERFLFNEERHLHSQSVNGWKTFSLIDENSQSILSQLHFNVANGIASSPSKAPFGSIEFANSLSAGILFNFLNEIEAKLKKMKVKKIVINDVPQLYRPHQAATLAVLLSDLSYQITTNEICSSIIVDESSWESKISKDELYHFKRCQREHLTFRSLEIT